jgi:hypothetical protein
MNTKQNRSRLSPESEQHLCKFLLSPFRYSGLKAYKVKHNISFPENTKKVSNRLDYLKKALDSDFQSFADLCNLYGINSTTIAPHVNTSTSFEPSTPKMNSQSVNRTHPTSKASSQVDGMRQHKCLLNLDFPHLNKNQMLWFRDDDVQIDNALYSVLTIYQPLSDPRDFYSIKLSLDENNPEVLHYTHLNIPTFMYTDYETMFKLEHTSDPNNHDVYAMTAKKHSKCAIKVQRDENHRLQKDSYRLPFALRLNKFSNIENTGTELQKNFRFFPINVTDKLEYKCAYVFWKVLIDEETTHLSLDKTQGSSQFDDALSRMSSAFGGMST